ncbi:MAG: hypothetical protein Kow0079_11010 [Vicingaceae bacterium]
MNIIKKLFLLFLAIFIGVNVFSQNIQATITYSINYLNLPEEFRAFQDDLPKEMKVLIKGNKSKTIQSTSHSGTTATISDADTKQTILLVDFNGFKNATVINYNEIKEEQDSTKENLKIKEVNGESPTILGYNCKKALIWITNSSEPIEVFYTEDIKVSDFNKQFKKLNGYPLKYTITENGLTMVFEATSINHEEIDDSEFSIPEGYSITNYSQIKEHH